MKYRVYDDDGRLTCSGVGDGTGHCCLYRGSMKGAFCRLLILWEVDELAKEIEVVQEAQAEVDRLRNVADVPAGESSVTVSAKGKVIDLWASLGTDPGLRKLMTRYAELALTECEERLEWMQWMKEGRYDMSIDNEVHDEKREMAMELRWPRWMSENVAWTVMRSVNEYIKCKVVARWSLDVLPEKAEIWASRANEMLTVLDGVTKKRNMGVTERSIYIL